MALSVFSDLGNGTGFIYLVAANGTDITTQFRNDSLGKRRILCQGNGPDMPRTSSTTSYTTDWRIVGQRFFLDSDAAAVEGVINGATAIEITTLVGNRPTWSANATTSATIAAGVISITRTTNNLLCSLATEGGAPTDDLDTITYSELVNNDHLILYGTSGGQVTTVRSGTGNIFLTAANNFVTSTSTSQLSLRYWNAGGGVATGWYEVSRGTTFPTVANLRAQSVAEPVQGITNLTMSTGATTTLVPGTDKEYLYLTGNPVLIADIIITTGGAPIDGDHFSVFYRATPTVGVFAVTVFGRTLTATQTQQNLIVTTVYSSVSGAWRTTVVQDTFNLDFTTTTQLATKENSLGNPAADGYSLTSTAAGVRTWQPNGNYPVLYNTTANNQTTAIITEEILKTYSVVANTLDTNGDCIDIETVYQTAATANAKTITVYFGATAMGTITGNFNADTILVKATVNRITATTQSAYCQISVFDTAAPGTLVAQAVQYTTPGETLTGAVSVNFNATNGVAAAGDIISRQASVRLVQKQ